MSELGKGQFTISDLVLKEALGLPAETYLVHVEYHPMMNTLTLVVMHKDLPECLEGCIPMLINPSKVWGSK